MRCGCEQRHNVAAKLSLVLVATLLGGTGCRSRRPPSPERIFDQIHAEFLRGHLALALREASTEELEWIAKNRTWSFKFCLLRAEILQFQGKSQNVVEALEEQEHTFTPKGDLAIKQLTLLSLAHARLGDEKRSAEELEEAQNLSQATQSTMEGEVLRTEGQLENRRGDQVAAQSSLQRSLDFARQHNDRQLEASDLLNLGFLALQSEHIDEALDRFTRSSQLAGIVHADAMQQSDIGNAGWAYYSLGDFERAIDNFREAGASAHALGATDSEILWLQDEGLSLSRLGDLKRAQACYEDALRAAEESGNITQRAKIENALALLYLQLNRLNDAKRHAETAFTLSQQVENQPSVEDASLSIALIAARTPSNLEAEYLLLQILRRSSGAPSIRWEAQEALAMFYESRHRSVDAERWYRRSIQTFEIQRSSVEDTELRLPFLANGDELYRRYAEFLVETNRSKQALHLLDGARAKTLQEGLGASPQGEQHVQHRTSATVTTDVPIILFYSIGDGKSYLWVLRGRAVHLFLLPSANEISTHVKNYQESILKSRDPLDDGNSDGIWLYNALVEPAKSLIAKGSNISIVPDGPLHGFNMETLVKDGSKGRYYWIEDVSVTISSSLMLAMQNGRVSNTNARQARNRLLLIGNPLPSTAAYPPLPNARTEIDNVEQYFAASQRTTLTQGAALPSSYAAARPEQYAYVHFVAHGVASTFHPLDSAIVLSPTPGDPEKFKLYARDILHQPLDARLVTISACYGSGVRNYAGEGMVGLAWAFLRAGAHEVIGALWEVDDSSTPELMDQMYGELARGARPEQALRSAKLSLLHSQGVFRKPLYWAAFQIYSGS